MGIHIHKRLGWGLDDVLTRDYDVTDHRINAEALKQWLWYGKSVDFYEWFKNNLDEAKSLVATTCGKSVDQTHLDITLTWFLKDGAEPPKFDDSPICHDPEYGLPNVLFIAPVEFPTWSRYDDTIDHCEEQIRGAESGGVEINYIHRMDKHCGIYPFIGMHRMPGSPEMLDEKKLIGKEYFPQYIFPMDFNRLTGRWSDRLPIPDLDVCRYLLENYRPQIPCSVILLTKFANIFNDWEKTVQQLRPMLYVHWS